MMTSIRKLFEKLTQRHSGFETYYTDLARGGVGYPTADEARKDMLRHQDELTRVGMIW